MFCLRTPSGPGSLTTWQAGGGRGEVCLLVFWGAARPPPIPPPPVAEVLDHHPAPTHLRSRVRKDSPWWLTSTLLNGSGRRSPTSMRGEINVRFPSARPCSASCRTLAAGQVWAASMRSSRARRSVGTQCTKRRSPALQPAHSSQSWITVVLPTCIASRGNLMLIGGPVARHPALPLRLPTLGVTRGGRLRTGSEPQRRRTCTWICSVWTLTPRTCLCRVRKQWTAT